jgi:methyl-accepting chemotaxis protein
MIISKRLLFNITITAALALVLLSGFIIFCSKSIINNVLISKSKEQLMLVRDFKKQELENFFSNLKKHLELLSHDQLVKNSFQEFKLAFDQLSSVNNIDNRVNYSSAISQYYNNIAKQYRDYFANTKTKMDFSVFLQNLNQNGINLQTKYMTNSYDSSYGLEYANIHDKYHDYFRKITNEFKYNDLMLLDLSGNVIYSTKKNIDFASSVTSGAFSNTEIANVFNAVRYATNEATVTISNFSEYLPDYQEPVLFVASKVPNIGVLVASVGLNTVTSLLKLPDKMTKTAIYLIDQDLHLVNQGSFGKIIHTAAAREAATLKKGFIEALGQDKTTNISYFTPIENASLSLVVESPKNIILQNLSKSLMNMFYFTAAIIPVLLFFVYTICCLNLEKADSKLSKISDFMQVVIAKKDLHSRMNTTNSHDSTNNMADVLNNMLSWFQNTLDQVAFKVKQFVGKYNDLLHSITLVSKTLSKEHALVDEAKNTANQLAIEVNKVQQEYQQYCEIFAHHQDACVALNDVNLQINQKQNIASLTCAVEYIFSICNLADMLSLQVSLEAHKNGKQQGHSFLILSKEIKQMTTNLKSQLMQIKNSFDSYTVEHTAIRDFVSEFSEKLKPINLHVGKLINAQKALLAASNNQLNTINKLQNNLLDLEVKYSTVNQQLLAIVDTNTKLNAEIQIDDYYPLKVVESKSS